MRIFCLEDDLDITKSHKKIICRKKSPEVRDQQLKSTSEEVNGEETAEFDLHVSEEKLKIMQREDPVISLLSSLIKRQATIEEMSDALRSEKNGMRFLRVLPALTIKNDVLIANGVPVFPARHLPKFVASFHKAVGHVGRDKTVSALSRYYYSPRLAIVTAFVVRRCAVCQKFKGRPRGGAPLYRRVPKKPYEDYAVDILELPPGRGNVKYLLVGIDTYTKFANAIPLKNKKSATVSRALEHSIFSSLFKLPETVTSDNGPEMRGKPFRQMLARQGVKHFRTIPYSPNCNGGVERLNATLKNLLSISCEENKMPWNDNLTRCLIIYNNTVHSQTGRAPADFFADSAVKVPLPYKEPYWKPPRKSFKPYAVGRLVAKKIPPLPSRSKFAAKFEGPFIVLEADPNGITYKIEKINGEEKQSAHYNQLKEWHGAEVQRERKRERRNRRQEDNIEARQTVEENRVVATEEFGCGAPVSCEYTMFGGLPISLSGLADKIATALREPEEPSELNLSTDNITCEDVEVSQETEQIEQSSLGWDHPDSASDVLEDTVIENPHYTTAGVASNSEETVNLPEHCMETRSSAAKTVENFVRKVVLNESRDDPQFEGSESSYSFSLKKGHPVGIMEDFELPQRYRIHYSSSISDGPDLSDHIQREIGSASDCWSADDEA